MKNYALFILITSFMFNLSLNSRSFAFNEGDLHHDFVPLVSMEELAEATKNPLTQKDIDFFLQYNKLLLDIHEKQTDEAVNAMNNFKKQSGLPDVSIFLAVRKVNAIIDILLYNNYQDYIDEYKMTEQDKNIVRKNLEEIKKLPHM
jgi:hypothetical protein